MVNQDFVHLHVPQTFVQENKLSADVSTVHVSRYKFAAHVGSI